VRRKSRHARRDIRQVAPDCLTLALTRSTVRLAFGRAKSDDSTMLSSRSHAPPDFTQVRLRDSTVRLEIRSAASVNEAASSVSALARHRNTQVGWKVRTVGTYETQVHRPFLTAALPNGNGDRTNSMVDLGNSMVDLAHSMVDDASIKVDLARSMVDLKDSTVDP
jgi:hypothetical protein